MNGAELIILGGPLAFGVAGLIWARHATRIRRAQKQNTNHASGDESHSDCTLCGMSDGLCVRCGRDPEEGEDMSDDLMKAIRAAFEAGCEQGSDEATAYDWGSNPRQTRNQAFEDFMAAWNPDSAPIRALLPQPPEDAR